jgi:hypothetical protein
MTISKMQRVLLASVAFTAAAGLAGCDSLAKENALQRCYLEIDSKASVTEKTTMIEACGNSVNKAFAVSKEP